MCAFCFSPQGWPLARCLFVVWRPRGCSRAQICGTRSPRDAVRRVVVHNRVRRLLVTAQVALALVLLASAGLFLRSFAQLTRENPGFDSHGVLTVRLSLSTDSYPDRASVVRLVDKVLPRLTSIPGVESAGIVSLLPLGGGHSSINFTLPDRPPSQRQDTQRANYRIVTPGYMSAMRIPLLSGRDFTEEDDANRTAVALISAPLARKLFSDRSPIGRPLLIEDSDGDPPPG